MPQGFVDKPSEKGKYNMLVPGLQAGETLLEDALLDGG